MEWRTVPEYTDYEVNEFGDLRWKKNGKLKVKIITPAGYVKYRVTKARRYRLAHRMVASAFIPNPENKPQVNHLDGDKWNNHVSNLEWCTNEENWAHALATGLWTETLGQRQRILSEDQVQEIRDLRGKMRQKDIANLYGVSQTTVTNIQTGKAWRQRVIPPKTETVV
jgi:hypothetical protein